MVKFSVIVPVYNAELYLDKCIRSIIEQTYNNFELILVNDGSSDGSGRICDEYAQIDCRIRVIHKVNGGPGDARNAGIDIAEGEYFCFVDADDWIVKEALQFLADEIYTNKPDVIIFGYAEVVNGKEIEHNFCINYKINQIKENIVSDIWPSYSCNKCFKRKLFAGETFPNGQVFEDLYIIPSIVYKAESISVIPDILYNYNKDNISSITSKTNSRKEYDFLLAVLKNYKLAKTEKLPYAEFCRSSVIEQAQKTIYIYILKTVYLMKKNII